MTLKKQIPQNRSRHPLSAEQLLFGWFSLFCLLLIFKNGEIASEYIHRGLLLCARSVIPSLFPFMVLSELLIRGGMGERMIGKIATPFPARFLFRHLRLPRCCWVLYAAFPSVQKQWPKHTDKEAFPKGMPSVRCAFPTTPLRHL